MAIKVDKKTQVSVLVRVGYINKHHFTGLLM